MNEEPKWLGEFSPEDCEGIMRKTHEGWRFAVLQLVAGF
jgi:hypothetical protein